jgi:broad specificity phosphatase PhoE
MATPPTSVACPSVLILARHGQTTANADGLLLGRLDPSLTELGQQQAAAIAASLGKVDRVIASPLLRARETAALIDGPVEIDERWIEIDYGIYDGVKLGDVPHQVWEHWRVDPTYVPEGGESLAAVGERVRAACVDLSEAAAAADIVVVSHVSPIKAAVAWSLGVGDEVAWRMFLALAAISRVAIGPRGPSLQSFNDTHHL